MNAGIVSKIQYLLVQGEKVSKKKAGTTDRAYALYPLIPWSKSMGTKPIEPPEIKCFIEEK